MNTHADYIRRAQVVARSEERIEYGDERVTATTSLRLVPEELRPANVPTWLLVVEDEGGALAEGLTREEAYAWLLWRYEEGSACAAQVADAVRLYFSDL